MNNTVCLALNNREFTLFQAKPTLDLISKAIIAAQDQVELIDKELNRTSVVLNL